MKDKEYADKVLEFWKMHAGDGNGNIAIAHVSAEIQQTIMMALILRNLAELNERFKLLQKDEVMQTLVDKQKEQK